MSRTKKLLYSCLTIIAFFAVLEGILAIAGVGPLTATEDPYVGFSGRLPLMVASEDETGRRILQTAPNKLVWFNDQRFVAKKRPGTRRVFCVGGSTTFGRPYWDATSYCGWLRELLPMVDDSSNWEVINAGGVSYASYRVTKVMEELAEYEPDLFVVYSAHNEFLEHRTYAAMIDEPSILIDITSTLYKTRAWSALSRLVGRGEPDTRRILLPAEVDELLNHSIGPTDYHRDPIWKRNVIEHYRLNLSRLVDIAGRSGAAIVLITPAANEKDCAPFKSELDAALPVDQQNEFTHWYDLGIQQSSAGQHAEALKAFNAAAQIDDAHAGLQYQIGKSLFDLRQYEDASAAFNRAVNEDICPLRATSEISLAIRTLVQTKALPVVDFEQRLRADCQSRFGHQILGEEYFLDHVHPRIEVHQQLAIWIIEQLAESRLINADTLTAAEIASVADRIQSHIDPRGNGIALRNLAKVLHWSGKFSEAAPRALDALKLLPDDPESIYVLADCLYQTGRTEAAIARYDHLLRTHPLYLRAMLPYAELLVEQKQFQRAKPLLETAIGLHQPDDPRQFRGKYFLGQVHAELGEFEAAIPLLQQVHDAYPEQPATLFYLAQSKSGVGQDDQAIQLYRAALALDPNHAITHQRIGLLLLQGREVEQAIQHFEAALRLDPDNVSLRQNLTIARQLIQ